MRLWTLSGGSATQQRQKRRWWWRRRRQRPWQRAAADTITTTPRRRRRVVESNNRWWSVRARADRLQSLTVNHALTRECYRKCALTRETGSVHMRVRESYGSEREWSAHAQKSVKCDHTQKKIKNQSVSDRLSDLFIKRAYRSVIDVPSSWVACSGPTPLVVVNRWPACQKYYWLVNRTAAVVNAAKAVVSFSSPPPPYLLPPAPLFMLSCAYIAKARKKEREENWTQLAQANRTHTHTHS